MKPEKIKVKGQKLLEIGWSDGSVSAIELMKLRRLCPCASCLAEREKESKSYIPLFFGDQLKIASIAEVGNYGLQIGWKDGHNTGIYEYPYLTKLAQE